MVSVAQSARSNSGAHMKRSLGLAGLAVLSTSLVFNGPQYLNSVTKVQKRGSLSRLDPTKGLLTNPGVKPTSNLVSDKLHAESKPRPPLAQLASVVTDPSALKKIGYSPLHFSEVWTLNIDESLLQNLRPGQRISMPNPASEEDLNIEILSVKPSTQFKDMTVIEGFPINVTRTEDFMLTLISMGDQSHIGAEYGDGGSSYLIKQVEDTLYLMQRLPMDRDPISPNE